MVILEGPKKNIMHSVIGQSNENIVVETTSILGSLATKNKETTQSLSMDVEKLTQLVASQ